MRKGQGQFQYHAPPSKRAGLCVQLLAVCRLGSGWGLYHTMKGEMLKTARKDSECDLVALVVQG